MVKQFRSAALVSIALASITAGQNPPTVAISVTPGTTIVGQSSSLSWSSVGATSCLAGGVASGTGGSPYIDGWNSPQAVSGRQTATQGSAGTYVYALTCAGNGGNASASATLTVISPGGRTTLTKGVTGLPADITALLSVAGIWQPVANQYLRFDGNGGGDGNGSIADLFAQNILLPNGREGLIAAGWSCCDARTPDNSLPSPPVPVTPVTIAILEQQPDGTLQLATSKYVSDPQTNGAGAVLVGDFNQDGIQDFFLSAYNESPFFPASSTAYISRSDGSYAKISVGDFVEGHGATVASINGAPTVFVVGYSSNCSCLVCVPNAYVWNGSSAFMITPQAGMGSEASAVVGDFYGNGTYSEVYGDFDPPPPVPHPVNGLYLYNLTGLIPAGDPVNVGDPYFNDKPQYLQYPSIFNPPGITHNYRTWLDDFNHDGQLDIVVQGSIFPGGLNGDLNILQMFQNQDNYRFADVTDALDPQYDQYTHESDYTPQVRDIDGSGINSYLLMSASNQANGASNNVILNDGSGNLQVALHETLNNYSQQVVAWIASLPSFSTYYAFSYPQTWFRAYQTEDGKLSFVAIVWIRRGTLVSSPLTVEQYVFVNVPLKFDLPSQFVRPIVVHNRNGSHLIRTFAGDDTICSGNNGGYSKVDGGLGTNTVVYSGPSQNYSATPNADGTWTIKDNVGKDGTDTLARTQRLEFTDIVSLAVPTKSGPAATIPAAAAMIQSAASTRRSPHPCR